MKKLLQAVIISVVLGCGTTTLPSNQPIDTAKHPMDTIVSRSAYYYIGDYWVDCAGASATGITVRSAVPITQEWTRENGSGGYIHIKSATNDSAHTHESDGTQNAYCGY